ncbi:MAG: bacillithiol biosynthesis cysteine-adding enzyme BshC [Balneolaceae bacterium]
MPDSAIPFSELGFSSLFVDYLQRDEKLAPFFSVHPFDDAGVNRRIENFSFPGNRSAIVQLLTRFNSEFETTKTTLDQIKKLEDPDSLAIVTGQQLGVFGGPLFTIYKICTAIALAKKYSTEQKRTVVPVFWLADEDHDFEETHSLTVVDGDDTHSVSVPFAAADFLPAVGCAKLTGHIQDVKKKIRDVLPETDFSEELWILINHCYQPGYTHRKAFGRLVLKLFGKHGLILAGSNLKHIKEYTMPVLRQSVERQGEISDVLDAQTYQLISDGYHGQVQVQESNLFRFREDGAREKITYDGSCWRADNHSFTTEELASDIEKQPERYSPNVFLRPLLQDTLLPTLMYVGGPGEIAYYAQMKPLYELMGMTMPIITPRVSLTLYESAIERIVEKLPFTISEYRQRIEDLEKQFVERTETTDIEKLFGMWRHQIQELSKEKEKAIREIDPSLGKTVGKASSTYFSELDKLKGKVYRSVKEQEEVQLNRIRKIKTNLFPEGSLQEREIAFLTYMNKYGISIWDRLLDDLKEKKTTAHHLYRL